MDLPAGILTLQRTDRWVGAPLCAILTLLRRIFECAGRPGPHEVRRILFVKFAEQGSTVLAYPAILRAIEMVGRENVYFVVFEDNRFILDAMEIIPEGNVITIATKSLFGLATGTLRAVLRVRKIGIDAVVDMEFLTRFSAIVTFATGAKSRVGFHTFFGDGPYRGDLMTHRLLYNPHLHTSQMFEAMVEALTGAPAEAVPNKQLADKVGSDRVIRLAGKTTLRHLLVLYARSEILVTNDSGPAHFASLTPIRVVTLFGPETPALFAARSPNATALWAGIACSPCVNAYNNRQSICRDNLCMQAITVDDVFKEVTRIYDSLKRATSGNSSAE